LPESAANLKSEGVQVVEGVGLVASSFQFFTCLAAVFAEKVSDFGMYNATGSTDSII